MCACVLMAGPFRDVGTAKSGTYWRHPGSVAATRSLGGSSNFHWCKLSFEIIIALSQLQSCLLLLCAQYKHSYYKNKYWGIKVATGLSTWLQVKMGTTRWLVDKWSQLQLRPAGALTSNHHYVHHAPDRKNERAWGKWTLSQRRRTSALAPKHHHVHLIERTSEGQATSATWRVLTPRSMAGMLRFSGRTTARRVGLSFACKQVWLPFCTQ
jgi:hypothetical protein